MSREGHQHIGHPAVTSKQSISLLDTPKVWQVFSLRVQGPRTRFLIIVADGPLVLQDISFDIKSGEKIGIGSLAS